MLGNVSVDAIVTVWRQRIVGNATQAESERDHRTGEPAQAPKRRADRGVRRRPRGPIPHLHCCGSWPERPEENRAHKQQKKDEHNQDVEIGA